LFAHSRRKLVDEVVETHGLRPEIRAQLLHVRSHLVDVGAELLEVLHLRFLAFARSRAELHLVLALAEHRGVGLADRTDGGRYDEQAQPARQLNPPGSG
jgi:hypothetical protein